MPFALPRTQAQWAELFRNIAFNSSVFGMPVSAFVMTQMMMGHEPSELMTMLLYGFTESLILSQLGLTVIELDRLRRRFSRNFIPHEFMPPNNPPEINVNPSTDSVILYTEITDGMLVAVLNDHTPEQHQFYTMGDLTNMYTHSKWFDPMVGADEPIRRVTWYTARVPIQVVVGQGKYGFLLRKRKALEKHLYG